MKVLSGQTLFDIAVQYCGCADAAFGLAVLNGLNLTDDLEAGQELQIPGVLKSDIATYYANKGLSAK